MRRVQRGELSAQAGRYLDQQQSDANKKAEANDKKKLAAHWKSSRKTDTMKSVLACLQAMMGPRQRCMYCVDSHGCDIEHFWPKAEFPANMYRWENLLLCCNECGRFKGSRFPLSGDQQPLLLDPSIDEPWQFLDFDPTTGNITARYNVAADDYEIKGETTIEIFQLDRREALAAGYQKTYRDLHKVIKRFLETADTSPDTLVAELIEHDDHGLLGWFFKGNGQTEAALTQLQTDHAAAWKACVEAFTFR